MFIIRKIIHLYGILYDKIFYRLQRAGLDFYKYYYVYSLFKKEDFKTNVLTKEQKLEIDNFYKKNYGKKISYTWHNLFTKYTGVFDVRYIPVDIFIKYVNSLVTRENSYYDIFKDKNFLYKIAKFSDINIPKRYFYSINNIFFDSDNNVISKETFYKQISNIGDVFIKPTQINNTGISKKVRLINIKNGIDIYSDTNIKDIIEKDYNMDFIIQEKITCHKSISDMYSQSVNTIQLTTYILNGKVKIVKPVVKLGMDGNKLDYTVNGKKILFVMIKDDGVLYDYAYCLSERKKYFAHPDTNFVFKNHKIENFQKVLEAAKKIQYSIPWMPFCGIEFFINEEGEAVILEIEAPFAVIGQVFSGEGFLGEDTEEVLSFLKKKRKKNKLL